MKNKMNVLSALFSKVRLANSLAPKGFGGTLQIAFENGQKCIFYVLPSRRQAPVLSLKVKITLSATFFITLKTWLPLALSLSSSPWSVFNPTQEERGGCPVPVTESWSDNNWPCLAQIKPYANSGSHYQLIYLWKTVRAGGEKSDRYDMREE